VHIHCYRADEMAIMLDLAKEFGFRITAFHHGVEAYKIADRLAAEGVCGALWADWWGFKMESFDGIQENIALVDRREERLRDRAFGFRGRHPAPEPGSREGDGQCRNRVGIEDHAGTRDPLAHRERREGAGHRRPDRHARAGKMADVVLWNGNPFSSYAQAEQVYVDGARLYDRRDRSRQPTSDFLLGQDAARGGVR
jgi:hypothetical protein